MAKWDHVPTKENPADLASRGVSPSELQDSNLWWHGPEWLRFSSSCWPKMAEPVRALHIRKDDSEPETLTRFSTLSSLLRFIAYCFRPFRLFRKSKMILDPKSLSISVAEINAARLFIIRVAQEHWYKEERRILSSGASLPTKHPLSKLVPFLDNESGVIRVGGRLSSAALSSEEKHPPILPAASNLSLLFVRYAHMTTLHGGPTLTSGLLNQYVWIVGRNRLVKTTIRRCVICQRVKPKLAHQLMGCLPASRTRPSRPFSVSGIDYAGPILTRMSRGRSILAQKGYIALFVCFATKAIHLELVSDLTTATFISAFKRFVSRRGICRHLHSDNASTFKGADTELRSMFRSCSEFYRECSSSLANDGTTWTFIPPTTPHYGGLWEAGVKSVKHHLRRAVGDTILTFEEMSTVLAEIEACVNSRPLCPMSSDPDDLHVLTPFHFLIGSSSGLVPDLEPFEAPTNRLDRYQLLLRMRNQFWSRWKNEYLLNLQERNKWRGPTTNFAIGQLVLLKDDRYPAPKWPLGRVIEVHCGSDQLVRVVTVRTADGIYKRHVARLCPLLMEESPEEENPEENEPMEVED